MTHTIQIHKSKFNYFKKSCSDLNIGISYKLNDDNFYTCTLQCSPTCLVNIGLNMGIEAAADITSSLTLKP